MRKMSSTFLFSSSTNWALDGQIILIWTILVGFLEKMRIKIICFWNFLTFFFPKSLNQWKQFPLFFFPGVPIEHIIGKLEVTPADRIRHMVDWKPPDPKQVGPCGGFSAQYLCMCDYYGLPFREEVAWDVDTIYFSHDSHELCLQDFEHLDHRDLTCISK